MGRLIVRGDVHGDMSSLYQTVQKAKLNSDDVLVILGDFGMIWDGGWQKDIMKVGRFNKGLIFVVLGNHENYDRIEQLPHGYDDRVKGEVWYASDNVVIAYGAGGVYELAGRKCFVVNGADSTDKESRLEHISWWKQECLNYSQMVQLYDLADEVGEVDYVFSHCTSHEVKYMMWNYMRYSYPMEKFLTQIYSLLTYKDAYFGHYHDNKDISRYHCLYNEYRELD